VLQRADSCRDILTWTFNPKVPGSRPGRPTTNDQFKGPSVLRLIAEAEHTDPDLACFLLLAATTGRGGVSSALCAGRISAGKPVLSRSLGRSSKPKVRRSSKRYEDAFIPSDCSGFGLDRRPGRSERPLSAQSEILWSEAYRLCSHLLRGSRRRSALGAERSDEAVHPDTAIGRPGFSPSARFRHFTATRLLSEGVPVRTVSGRLGHANAATTRGVYAHFVEESDRDGAEKIGSLLAPSAEGRSRS
jgi:Phage integrase family